MGLQPQPGEGEVRRIDLGPDLEVPTVVRLAHMTEQIHDIEQRAGGGGRTHHLGKAIAHDLGQPVVQTSAALFERSKITGGHVCHQARVPGLNPVFQPAALSGYWMVVRMRLKPSEIEQDVLAFGGKAYVQRPASRYLRSFDSDIGGDIAKGNQPLAATCGAGLGILRIVPQPYGMKAQRPR